MLQKEKINIKFIGSLSTLGKFSIAKDKIKYLKELLGQGFDDMVEIS